MFKRKTGNNYINWQNLFCLWCAQGFIGFIWLWLLPTNTQSEIAFGFSASRLALLGGMLLLTSGSFALFIQAGKVSFRDAWLDLKKRTGLWDFIYLMSLGMAVLVPVFVLILLNLKGNITYHSYALRLSPLAFWVMFSGLEFVIFLAFQRREGGVDLLLEIGPLFRNAVFVLGLLLVLGMLISVTRIGISPERNWGEPAIPFFEWQILFTVLFIGAFAFFSRITLNLNEKWIVIGIYIFTLILWLSQPVHPANFATPPRLPNFEIYPFSDPLVYAQSAQSAIVGNGFLWPEVPARPFYIACLTWFLVLGDQNYNAVIFLQTLVLGFFPVMLYLIGREFGGRPLGLGLALLTIFRDINANFSVQFASGITYSKLFLSELPVALLICLATLISIRWIRQSNPSAWLPFLAGGMFGVATLIRTQSLILLGVIVLIALFSMPTRKQWLIASSCLMLGVLIVLAPWLARNYLATGGLLLDNPLTQTMTMTRRWSGSEGNEILPRLPGESDAGYSNRMMKEAFDIMRHNPGFVLRTAANHFINSEIGSLVAFPVRDEIQSPAELLLPQRVFWKTPLTASQMPLFTFNLLFFSVGVVASYRRHRFIGLLPLGLGLVYNLWSALFFTSGVRFIVPLDWSIHLYQVFGLLILGAPILVFTHGGKENVLAWLLKPSTDLVVIHESGLLARRRFFQTFILILFLGAFIPITEFIFPEKYPLRSQAEIAKQIGVIPESGEIVLYGSAIYPRYYEAGDGEPDTAKIGYAPNEKARLIFFLVGSKNTLVVFELDNAPAYFPNTADVFMIGTQTEQFFSPRIVKVVKDSQSATYENR